MSLNASEEPLPPRPETPRRRGSELIAGAQLPPLRRLKVISADDLEDVVWHWVYEVLEARYHRVLQAGGTGDKGNDVIGYLSDDSDGPWDNYQCKHYAQKLQPNTILSELAKLVYWCSQDAYRVPMNYWFVAPLGVSESTREWLRNPSEVRERLQRKWHSYGGDLCSYDEIKDALEVFEFPGMDVLKGEDLVRGLQNSRVYPFYFGSGLTKSRPVDIRPPDEIAETELVYVERLLEAYADHSGQGSAALDEITADDEYGAHFRDSRREFYCAESLREFSKDQLVEHHQYFEDLQQQIYDGVIHTVRQDFSSGYERVLAACEHATTVQIDDHPLRDHLRSPDRSGICHQLANDTRLRWIR